MYGIGVRSTITKYLVLPDLSFFEPSKGMNVWQKYAAKNLAKSVAAADNIVTYSNAVKKQGCSKKRDGSFKDNSISLHSGRIFQANGMA